MKRVSSPLRRGRESNFHSFISLLTIVTMALAAIGLSPKPQVQANNYDVVIEVTIGQEDYKVLEINNTTGDVNFYEFTVDGNPVLDGNNEQTTFVPGDNDFEDRMLYVGETLLTSNLTITSTISFDLHIYTHDISNSKLIREIEYDVNNPTDYCIVDHPCYGSPFNLASVIGEFLYVNYGQTTYSGYYYVPDIPLLKWDKSSINGQLDPTDLSKQPNRGIGKVIGRPKTTIEGTTSSGRKIKIVDNGDGSGPRIYEDKNGDGEFSDDEEITDNKEKEKIFNEVANDIKNGNGSYEASAVDADGNPVDVILWFKNSDGTYTGINIDYNSGTGTWDLSAKTNCTSSCLRSSGYFPSPDDHEPTYAWFVGYKTPDAPCYGFERYARFNENDELDENGEQKPYRHEYDSGNYTVTVCKKHQGEYLRYTTLVCDPWPNCC